MISQLITKKVTGDILMLSFVEEEGFCKLMVFVEREYKRTTNTREDVMF